MPDDTTVDYRRLKEENGRLNLAESRAQALTLRSRPRFVMVELTQGCNLRCPMCRSRQIGYREREMDRGILDQVAAALFPTAEVVDIRGWGESLLVTDIDEIICRIASYQARCRVVTNMSLRRPATLDLLVEVGALVDVSLDAADQAVLDEVRSGARLSLITENLRLMVARFAEVNAPADSLRMITTMQRSTLDHLPDLVRYAADVGVRQIVLNEVTVRPGDPAGLDGLADRVDAAVEATRTVADELGVELFAGTSLGRCVGVRKNAPACIHPWSYLTVGYDGSVGYCDHLIGPIMQHYSMGDLAADDLGEIWNGPRWQELRRWHAAPDRADRPDFHGCFACYQHRNVDFEDVFEPALERYRLNLSPAPGPR
ncbi:radical SAM protein [Dactylosporangium sp. NPDC051485]|uniref:radical SAM protein n=1 Tax=Dactylosporangium sp. NPDC051485 TaxID=3154846 RepID=UPI003442E0F3